MVLAAKNPVIFWASLRTSLFVGSILNTINQGGAFIEGAPIAVGHLLMNYVVPFCVSSYSAARNEIFRNSSNVAQEKQNNIKR
ncbi:nitrate/nitrite transporter NrtS [Noviherbaspirillum sp. DKR-6]|uniref:Nitrate/nitrite transporter NrtS n=1 Tax=Noviherbaspirillum pedocola TaxID=2801341 RepID=A0A934SUH7_9BURK|nr:nitrate/nitrite transporter NrtS [Noviherbaspirillum pedocola]